MGSAKALLFAGAATLLSLPAAQAADLPAYMPLKAPVVQEFSGWYLRGDIGMTNQQLKSLDNVDITAAAATVTGLGFDSGMLFGLGVGYQFNNWLRGDLTGEYRGKANFHGADFYNANTAFPGANNYSGSKSELLFMANAYVDLGTWWGVTPFIGAGVGTSRNTISGFRDTGVVTNQFGQFAVNDYATDNSKWNFAWALHAGLAYRVTPGFTVELAYRYVDLGSATTALPNTAFQTGFGNQNTWTFNGITSHDVKLGVRWDLGVPDAPVYAPPLMRKG